MKLYQKTIYFLLLIYIITYPIFPTYEANTDIILYALFILQLLGLLFKSERKNAIDLLKNLSKDKILIFITLLNLIMYASTLVSSSIRTTLIHSIRFSMYIITFYSLSYKVKNKKNMLFLFKAFIGVAVLSGVYTLLQLLYTFSLGYKIDKTIRMTSFLENSNNLAAYTILSFFIVIMLLITNRNVKQRSLLFICSLLLFINIVFSQSRNALIALVIGAIIIAILYDIRFLLLSVLIPIIFLIIPTSRARIFQLFDITQNSSRFKIWEITRQIIVDNPLWGIGYENFSIKFPIYVDKNPQLNIKADYIAIHPHNMFLKIQSELGILGSILLILFIVITFTTLYKLIASARDKITKALLIGITTSYLTFLFMNLLDCYFSAPKVICSMFILLAFANYYKNSIVISSDKLN